jgi:hypothetical protein
MPKYFAFFIIFISIIFGNCSGRFEAGQSGELSFA